MALFCVALYLVGCASSTDHPDRSALSDDLQQRAGHSLNPKAKPGVFTFPENVTISDGISQEEAVAIALWNNPTFHETLSKLGFSRADVVQAGLLSNPALSVLFPWGPKQAEFAATFPLEVLWLRPRRVAAATLEADRVAASLVQNGLDVIRDVQWAYSDLLLAQERVRVAEEAHQLRGRIAELAEGNLRAGNVSELETVSARVDALRAGDEVKRLRQDLLLAGQRLRHLMGMTGNKDLFQFGPGPEISTLDREVSELEREALASRPDLRAAELGMEAAGKRLGLAQSEIFLISGVLDANASGKKGFEMGPGLQLPIPIFNRNQGGISRARAEMERAAWHYLGVKDQIILEVREAYTRFLQAREDLLSWEQKIIPPLEATVRQGEKAFQLGDMSLLLVYENTRQLLAARLRQVEVVADQRRAWANLQRSVGHALKKPVKDFNSEKPPG